METTIDTINWGATWGTAGAIVFLLFLSAFFSGSETALTAASRAKLRSQADKGSAGAERALQVTEDNERLIGSVLLGNNIVNILSASLATALFTMLFGEGGVAIATLVMTALVLVFAEVLPKTYAITNPERASSLVAPIIAVVIRVFSPVVSAVRAFVRVVLSMVGVDTDPDGNIMSAREEITGAITLGHNEGSVEKEDRDRLLGALDLADRFVEEIMLHRSGIEMINVASAPSDILDQCLHSRHTRLPVFRDEPENVIGMVHSKDLLRAVDKLVRTEGGGIEAMEKLDVTDVMMEPYFIPETTTLDDQMRQFLRRHTHFALVVDEYGALQGLITLEDILEEIVGEITDEFDHPEEPVLEAEADGTYLIEGNMTIRDLNRATEWGLPDDEANTVAGLVIHEAQTIPTTGQVFSFHGFRFEVAAREANRITQLRIRQLG
ncbi:HlyC/CorC family transporter [Jannaschia donghaensis]|uniref:Magnesium and cobalt efflux protein CorC n=1 Tax=Jannaschia donghaensis TaxID=420998 RepID=A0A0M6YLS2_9RHOB|nr:HlyC/CorC family transporter [Jannaschia donghaensis]CTQ50844.1 Magnesium and cobalt efflux protein CorC [Jannaschia donghaensis]